jgi:RNA polymerase sigma-70 factor (ECF subfamily)
MTVDSEALFLAHQNRLFRYFLRAVGESDAARDLTQDVFVRVSRTQVPQVEDGQVRAWLFRIARNLVLDHHRKRVIRVASSGSESQESRLPSQDVALAVNEALSALADLDRDVFLMREIAGLGYDEISQACGLTPDAVRSRIHRTRLQLRDQLAAPVATRRTIPMRLSGRDSEK